MAGRIRVLDCVRCASKPCREAKDCTDFKEEVLGKYQDPDVQKLTRISSTIEAAYYMQKCRLEETIEFCKMMNFGHVGVAFCIGLSEEAKVVVEILEKHIKVTSVCCKICGIDKVLFELPQIGDQQPETMCNPIGQAELLNRAETDLNLIVGLCIGHDIQFTNFSTAPVSTLVVKDRLLAHNPVGAIYSGYYRRNVFVSPKK